MYTAVIEKPKSLKMTQKNNNVRFVLKIVALLMVIAFASGAVKAKPKTKWNPGFIILDNHDKVEGNIQFVGKYDAVVCQLDGKIKTYSVHNVKYFEYFDQKRSTTRHFAALSESRSNEFVEVITTGHFNIIRKDGKFYINVNENESIGYNTRWQLLNNKETAFGSVDYSALDYVPLEQPMVRSFKQNTLPKLADQKEDIEAFIKENRLNPNDLVSQLYIMEFYNFLKSEEKANADIVSASSN